MEYLKELRTAKGVSQQSVADYLGITRQAYSNYENGNRAPDNETLLKLAEYFRTTVDRILRGKTEEAPIPEDERDASDEQIMAAFWGGDKDLSSEDMKAMWGDVKNFAAFVAQKKKQEKQKHD